jgi:hypothetical protein
MEGSVRTQRMISDSTFIPAARRLVVATAATMLGLALLASPADAQGRGKGKQKHSYDRGATYSMQSKGHGKSKAKKVPPGHLPPAGLCRVWYDGTPPGHQPPPTDCGTARREAYRTGGRVIYGGNARGDERYDRRDRDDDSRYGRDRDDDGRYDRGDRVRDGYCSPSDRYDPDCSYDRNGRTTTDPRYPDSRYPNVPRDPNTGQVNVPATVWGVITGNYAPRKP